MSLINLSQIARSPGDPRVEQGGATSLTESDRLARSLGWFSFALGALEILAPRRITEALGMEGQETLVRAFGVREILAGVPTLSVDKQVGLAARVAGDIMDLAALAPALRADNPKRGNALVATTVVAAITILDMVALAGVTAQHRRSGDPRDFSDRSGFPKGIGVSRRIARGVGVSQPRTFRTLPT